MEDPTLDELEGFLSHDRFGHNYTYEKSVKLFGIEYKILHSYVERIGKCSIVYTDKIAIMYLYYNELIQVDIHQLYGDDEDSGIILVDMLKNVKDKKLRQYIHISPVKSANKNDFLFL